MIDGNEIDQVARRVIGGWTGRKHDEYWQRVDRDRLRTFVTDHMLKSFGISQYEPKPPKNFDRAAVI